MCVCVNHSYILYGISLFTTRTFCSAIFDVSSRLHCSGCYGFWSPASTVAHSAFHYGSANLIKFSPVIVYDISTTNFVMQVFITFPHNKLHCRMTNYELLRWLVETRHVTLVIIGRCILERLTVQHFPIALQCCTVISGTWRPLLSRQNFI